MYIRAYFHVLWDPKWSQNDPQIEQNPEKYTGNQTVTPKNASLSDLGPKMKPK